MGKYQDLTALLDSFVEKGPAGCGCALAQNGKVLYEHYSGMADVAAGRPIDENSVYRLFSMTKVIICTAAMMLFERGRFLLDDPLHEYFPEYHNTQVRHRDVMGGTKIGDAVQPMLVKHAFAMAVGLPYPFYGTDTANDMLRAGEALRTEKPKFTLRDEIRAMAQVPVAFEPGTHWLYGYGHELVAGLIEVASGKTVGRFLEEEIFAPLGMTSTGYRYHGDLRERMTQSYRREEDGTLTPVAGMLDHNHEPDAVYEGGGAGLFSTVSDYLRFSQMLANGGELDGERIIGRKTIDLMRANQLNDQQLADFAGPGNSYLAGYGYGLGIRTMMNPAAGNSNGSVGEFGWTGAMGTWTSIDPSEGFSAVYMHQMMPNMEAYHHLRVRAAAYGCLR
jgi:CubicO group peptidase (beta-lactamase class C family)